MTASTLTANEQALAQEWQARVARFKAGDATAMPEGVTGVGELRIMGRAGDARLPFPRVSHLSDLESLPNDVQFGLVLANHTIETYRAQGAERMVYASAPADSNGVPEPEQITVIDPAKHCDVLIVAPIAGG